MKKIKVGILGYGTVGSGTHEILTKNHDLIQKRTGVSVEVVRILRRKPSDSHLFTDDPDVILNDPDIDLIVEVIGGIEPATSFMLTAMKNGKHVVTANKAAVAANYKALTETAEENGVDFLFEAAVAGGIPVLTAIQNPLQGNNFLEVMGILNGTTNYILTKMTEDGASYADVLKDAQEKGFAEADPTADVEGYDACRKIAILTSLAYGQQVDYEDIYTEGITKITAEDFKYAKALGAAIKIFGTSRKEGNKLYAMVAPQMIQADNPLYAVNDVFNAIFVRGNMLGDAMFYGSGAGKLPTASAVVADMVEIAKHIHTNIFVEWSSKKQQLVDYKQASSRFFVRTNADEQAVKAVFGDVEFVHAEGVTGELGFVTAEMTEAEYEKKAEQLGSILQMIRVK